MGVQKEKNTGVKAPGPFVTRNKKTKVNLKKKKKTHLKLGFALTVEIGSSECFSFLF